MSEKTSPHRLLDEPSASDAAKALKQLHATVSQTIYGQEALITSVIMALLSRGHLLLEGLPGLGKTELVRTFSSALELDANRLQFTPDLLPGDITGNPMLQETGGERQFVFQKGPIFTNLLLADEINRASPKTQSAMLEAMQERQVTVMGETHPLPVPFFVFATQNPIELEGTYPLPEAQLDRFLFKLTVTRASCETLERIVSSRILGESPKVERVMHVDSLREMMELARQVFLPDVVKRYIARLVHATYPDESDTANVIQYGASPRAAIGLAAAAKARALMEGRVHASVDDVQEAAVAVLGHRIVLKYQARLEGITPVSVVETLLKNINPEEKALPKTLAAAKIQ